MNETAPFLPELADAIDSADIEQVRHLFVQNPEQVLAFTPFAGATWLHYAASDGNLETIQLLLSLGMDVNVGDRWDGSNPLCRAASGGRYENAKFLLDNGASMDTSASIRNPLFAAISGSIHTNATFPPPTGDAPAIVRLLLDRGIDAKVVYNTQTMKNMDAVAFAMMMGARELAHIIALWNANGDEDAAQLAMKRGLFIAHQNTVPVDPDEDYADS